MAKENLKIEKPKSRKVRGTGIYEGDGFMFRPCEAREPAQKNVKEIKGSKIYETCSERSPLKVAHLTCRADNPDLYAEFTGQLAQLGVKPLTPKQQPNNQRLMNEGDMEVWLNQAQGILTYTGSIDLCSSCNWQSELMRQLQLVVRTLPADEKFKKIINKLKKEKNV